MQIAHAADTVVIDLSAASEYSGSDYDVNTTTNTITYSDDDPVIIKGNGTNGGDGWTIIIENATDITIENNTTIFSTSIDLGALNVPHGATITGKDSNISITGNYMGISADGSLIIDGTIGSIAATRDVGTNFAVFGTGDIEIAGTIDSLSGINSISAVGGMEISGRVGDVNGFIRADDDIKITGRVGDVNGVIFSNGNLIISGTVENISGDKNGIGAAGGVTISKTGKVGNISVHENGISAGKGVTIHGGVGNITTDGESPTRATGIYAVDGGVIISETGKVGNISGNYGILVGDDSSVTIHGEVGNITATNAGIEGEFITISGKAGNITGGDYGMFTFSGVTINGETGAINGGDYGICALGGLTLGGSSVVYASSLSPETTVSDMSQGILFVGNAGTVHGNVTLAQNLTVTAGQTLTVPNGASLTIPSGVTLTNSGRIQNNGRINSSAGGFRGTSPTGNPVRYIQSSSGSGSSSSGQATAAPANTPVNITQAAAITATNNAIAAARAAGSTIATVKFRNPGEISLSTLQAMVNSASQAGMTLRLQADSMSSDGKSVDVRISLDPTLAKTGLNLSASTTNTAATQTTRTFTKFFENDVMTVALGQKAGFGQQVRIAAKLDPKLKTDNLYFYVFDPENNNFQRIPEPKYFVDKNGYVHFTTSLSGNIVISDGALARK